MEQEFYIRRSPTSRPRRPVPVQAWKEVRGEPGRRQEVSLNAMGLNHPKTIPHPPKPVLVPKTLGTTVLKHQASEAQRGAVTHFKVTELSGWQTQTLSTITNQPNKKRCVNHRQGLIIARKKWWGGQNRCHSRHCRSLLPPTSPAPLPLLEWASALCCRGPGNPMEIWILWLCCVS